MKRDLDLLFYLSWI